MMSATSAAEVEPIVPPTSSKSSTNSDAVNTTCISMPTVKRTSIVSQQQRFRNIGGSADGGTTVHKQQQPQQQQQQKQKFQQQPTINQQNKYQHQHQAPNHHHHQQQQQQLKQVSLHKKCQTTTIASTTTSTRRILLNDVNNANTTANNNDSSDKTPRPMLKRNNYTISNNTGTSRRLKYDPQDMDARRIIFQSLRAGSKRIGRKHIKNSYDFDRSDIIVCYIALVTITLLVSYYCPGGYIHIIRNNNNHNQHNDNDEHLESFLLVSSTKWDIPNILFIVIGYFSTIISFFYLECSDPGYLNPTILLQMNDGYDDLGVPVVSNNDNRNKNNSNNNNESPNINSNEDQQHALLSNSNNNNKGSLVISSTKQHQQTQVNEMNATSSCSRTLLLHNDKQIIPLMRRRKVCTTCRIAPPIRGHHCKICNRCIATFDHHCEFVGVCIGEKNRGRYFLFLFIQCINITFCIQNINDCSSFFTTLLSPTKTHYNFISSYDYYNNIIDDNDHNDQPLTYWKIIMQVWLTRLYLYGLGISLYFLFTLHIFLASTNTTTFEWGMGKHLDYFTKNNIYQYQCPFWTSSIFHNIQQYFGTTYYNCNIYQVIRKFFVSGNNTVDNFDIGSKPAGAQQQKMLQQRQRWKPTIWEVRIPENKHKLK